MKLKRKQRKLIVNAIETEAAVYNEKLKSSVKDFNVDALKSELELLAIICAEVLSEKVLEFDEEKYELVKKSLQTSRNRFGIISMYPRVLKKVAKKELKKMLKEIDRLIVMFTTNSIKLVEPPEPVEDLSELIPDAINKDSKVRVRVVKMEVGGKIVFGTELGYASGPYYKVVVHPMEVKLPHKA